MAKKLEKVQADYEEDFGPAFQQHILAVCARVPGFVRRRRDVLDHRFFVAETHRSLAEVLFDHIDEHEALPSKATLVEDLKLQVGKDDLEVVSALVNDLYQEDVQDYEAVEAKVVSFGKRQAMLLAVLEGAEKIDKGDPSGVEPLIRRAMLVGENLTNLGMDFVDTLEARIALYRKPDRKRLDKIPTGIAHLDYLLNGGIGRGALGVILAPPKRGKTTTLVNFGFGALTDLLGLNVVHYTCEMPEAQVTERYDDRLLGSLVQMKSSKPRRFTDELRKRVKSMVHGRLLVKEYATRSATVDTLRSHLSVVSAQGVHPDLVIVDYAGILRPTGRRQGDERHLQASVFEELRAMAGEFHCGVWTAQQANRGSLDKDTLTMGDLAETFESAAIADALIALCQTVDERADGLCRLFFAADRGPSDGMTVNCSIRRDLCRITSIGIEDVSRSRVVTKLDRDYDEDDPGGDSKEQALSKARKATGSSAPKKSEKKSRKSIPTKKVPKK